ncbi:unnamed protein product [Acanthoscelides obtectus]|uniref:Uncharacterized protein n=1 Tax=Acanthoscelides obtectus TaxID=200917 RepID=A0A9P0PBT0_ACAOB|nr:unnamed protein product [Acanthoscelides obtectus]CAK1675544.1 Odorant receptor 42b [Acanthoscelides obtectus]
MQNKSEKIPLAAFYSSWIDASNSVKKDLIFFLANAQKPLKFYAVDFFDVSIGSFLRVMKTAFSYYTMLYNVNKKNSVHAE